MFPYFGPPPVPETWSCEKPLRLPLALPSCVALVVAVVGAGLRHAEGKRGADEDVAALVGAEHGVDLGDGLRVSEGGGGDDEKGCGVQK